MQVLQFYAIGEHFACQLNVCVRLVYCESE